MSSASLFCPSCGEPNDAQARFCRKCGAPQPSAEGATSPQTSATASPTSLQPAAQGAGFASPAPSFAAAGFRGYGGFWLRVLATIIDGLVLGVVIVPFIVITVGMSGLAGVAAARDQAAVFAAVLPLLPLLVGVPVIIAWLYEALLTSSAKQATLGHLALGMKVVDRNGQRLSFALATGRHFAKLINNFTLYIGWLLVAFTERKQGLHDFICGTYMIKT